MPLWVQVTGWLVFLFLFVFLVLYPLIGVSYFEGKVIKIDRDQSGNRITPNMPRLRIHKLGTTTLTNEDGEFTIGIRGPIVPMTGIDFDFGENDYVQHFAIRAPVPFLSLFNPNLSTVYYVSKANQYFMDEKSALKAFDASVPPLQGLQRRSQVVYAASIRPVPSSMIRIRKLKLDRTDPVDNVYFEVRVNEAEVRIDGIPNSDSSSSRMPSIEPGKALSFDNFDVPAAPGESRVSIRIVSKRLLIFNNDIASFNFTVAPADPASIGRAKTIQEKGAELVYEILPPLGIGCAGIQSSERKALSLTFWLDVSPQFLDTVSAVQYDLGPAFSSRTVAYPNVGKADYWSYGIFPYTPQVIRAKATIQGGGSMDLSTLCKPGREQETAMAYYALSRSFYVDRQYAEAIKNAEIALTKDPTLIGAFRIKGGALGATKDFSGAFTEFQKALSSDAAGAPERNSFAWFVADTLPNPTAAQLQQAKKYALEAVNLQPNASYFDTLGWIYYKLGDYSSSLQALEKARDITVSTVPNTSAWQAIELHLGYTLTKLNRTDDASKAFKEVADYGVKFPSTSRSDYVSEANRQMSKIVSPKG